MNKSNCWTIGGQLLLAATAINVVVKRRRSAGYIEMRSLESSPFRDTEIVRLKCAISS